MKCRCFFEFCFFEGGLALSLMFSEAARSIQRGKGPEGISGALSDMLALFKRDELSLKAVCVDAKAFNGGLEEITSLVSRAIGQAKSKGPSLFASSPWVAACRSFCAFLNHVCRRGSRLCGADGLPWEQASLQSVVQCILKWYSVCQADGSRDDLLRTAALCVSERSHLLGKDLQDSLMNVCLPLCVPLEKSKIDEGEDEQLEEDDRDGEEQRVARPSQSRTVIQSSTAALLCCAALLTKAKRRSRLAEAFGVRCGRTAFQFITKSIASVGVREELRAIQAALMLADAAVACGGLPATDPCLKNVVAVVVPLLFTNTFPANAKLPSASTMDDDSGVGTTDASESGLGSSSSPADRVRIHALVLLSTMASCFFKQLANDLVNTLLPYSTKASSFANSLSLYALILYDPNIRVRMHAILLLAFLLKPAKNHFSAAMDRGQSKNPSFISLSFRLALVLRDMHAVLAIALSSEEDAANKSHLLRVVPVLVSVTPYDRLESNVAADRVQEDSLLLVPILKRLQPVNSEQLLCILQILRAKATLPEVNFWLGRTDVVQQVASLVISGKDPNADLCLVEMCRKYHSCVVDLMANQGFIKKVLSEPVVSADAVLAVAEFCSALSDKLELDLKCWRDVLAVVLPRQAYFFGDASPPKLLAAILSLISGISAASWADQGDRAQVMIMSIVTGSFAEGTNPEVRSSSVRSVGRLLLIEQLTRENEQFLVDADRILCVAVNDEVPDVISFAYWGLGNLCHSIASISAPDESFLSMLANHLKLAVSSFDRNLADTVAPALLEKIKCSCLRVIGKAGSCVDGAVLEPLTDPICAALLSCLSGKSDRPKLRWNVFNALSVLLEGPFAHAPLKDKWCSDLNDVLEETIFQSSNFKERISCVSLLEKHMSRCPWLMQPATRAQSVIERALAHLDQNGGTFRANKLQADYFEQYEAVLKRTKDSLKKK